jgi:hypothetical protein
MNGGSLIMKLFFSSHATPSARDAAWRRSTACRINGAWRLWDAVQNYTLFANETAGKAGEDVVQKCTTLAPKIAGMASCGAYLHRIRHFSRKSSECSAKMHHLASMPV